MAAVASPTFDGIKKALKEKRLAPLYILHGEEGYFIDALAKAFEDVLTPDEREFNQYVLYGPEVEPAQVVDICRRFPMMSDRQMVILKEAQAMRADKIEKLKAYAAAPVESTTLVVCFRGEKAKGKEFMAAAKKSGAIIFETPRIYDNTVGQYIAAYLKEKGVGSDPKAIDMLRDHVGTDLSRIYNEVDKLCSLLPPGGVVTPELVERHIGVSKEYNSFELVDAIAERNALKCFKILAYFKKNPKAAPTIAVTASIFNLFADLLTAFYVPGGSDAAIMEQLKIKPFALRRIRLGMSRYNAFQIIEIIRAIRQFDVSVKGIDSRQNEQLLFHDLIYHILSATGRL